ncbi:hypothetical protein F383_17389 [Gossypium arboreum]|uniref:Uncharacterized protein n=1 Tax=Gossypium arboreum TaxID=29729 RepID=A0A0B0NUA3_GOSAR|nr:hypothetical protein F383_17389 [Gossypium arboreum]
MLKCCKLKCLSTAN